MNIVEPIRNREQINAVKRILNESGSRDLLLFILGINTGLRVSDLLRLKVRDVKDRSIVRLREKKTYKMKQFPIPNEIKDFIKEYVAEKPQGRFLFKTNMRTNRFQESKRIGF